MIGQTISHYQIVELLGQGGMGVVYAAIDTHLDRRVAIKFLTASSDPQYRARFLREARAVSKLNHSNIATVHDYGETATGQPFIVMELVKGETLGELLDRSALSLRRAVQIIEAVAEALGEAHQHGIVHRDVKPSNVVVTERGQVKVLDFGLVKDLNEDDENGMQPGARERLGHRTRSDVMVGTPLYLSPEQATSGAVDGRSDLFALGAVLYECISGQSAFSGSSVIEIGAQVIHVDPPAPSSINPRVPPELDRITMKALAKKPEQRYQNAAEMIVNLQTVDATLELGDTRITRASHPSATNPSAVMKITETLRRPRLSLGIFVIALLVAGAAVWFVPQWLRRGPHKPSAKAEVLYQTGTEALRAGAYQQAAKVLEQATTADPNFALAHARLGEALLEQDYADRGRRELLEAKLLVADPSVLPKADALYLDAITAVGVQDYGTAIAAYREIVNQNPRQAHAHLDLGRAFEKNEQIDEAIRSYVEATNLDSGYAPAFLRAGILYQRKQQIAAADQNYSKAEALFQTMGSVEGQTEVLLNRGALLRERSKFPEAEAQLQRAYDLAEAYNSELQKINALIELGRVAYSRGAMNQAETYQKQAIDFAQRSRLETPLVRCLINLGNTRIVSAHSDEAEKNYYLALEIAKRNESSFLEALSLSSLATLSIKRLKASEGLQFAERALAIFEKGGYRNNVTICLSSIGRALRRQGHYEEALKAMHQRLSRAETAGSQRQIASSYADIASVLFDQERYPEALKNYEESYKIYKDLNDRLNLVYNLMNRGNVLSHLGDYSRAEALLSEAEKLASSPEGRYPWLLTEIELVRAQMALSQQRFGDAKVKSAKTLAAVETVSDGLSIQAKYTLGLAQSFDGARSEGQRLCEEAVTFAKQADDVALLSRTMLALAKAQLTQGAAGDSLATAQQAEQRFSNAGQQDSQWQAAVIASRACSALHDDVNAEKHLARASALVTGLRTKWGEEAFSLYITRPDIKLLTSNLAVDSR